jgi:anti-sigma regulatory factor (Ser/Thr protein kinase)
VTDEIVRPAELASLPALVEHALAACARAGLDTETTYAVRLAVEEVVMNLIAHGYVGRAPGPIGLSVDASPTRVVVTISDEARPFDPASAATPDVGAPLEEWRPGGLGLHLVRQLLDDIRYESSTDGNRLTLVKLAGKRGA